MVWKLHGIVFSEKEPYVQVVYSGVADNIISCTVLTQANSNKPFTVNGVPAGGDAEKSLKLLKGVALQGYEILARYPFTGILGRDHCPMPVVVKTVNVAFIRTTSGKRPIRTLVRAG